MDCATLTNPANGQVSHNAGTTFGQIATYSCNTGYNLVGGSTRSCQATGAWSRSAPTCQRMSLLMFEQYQLYMHIIYIFLLSTAVDCGTLTNPANGQVNHTAGSTFRQTATYSCNAGYNLVGGSTRSCQATGAWSRSAPTCQRRLLHV